MESVSPSPTGDVDLYNVNDALPERIAVVGGIEPVKLLNSPTEEVVDNAREIMKIMSNRGYVLANSDSCPPGVSIEKFEALARLAKEA